MRIKMLRKAASASVDGLRLDRFEPGHVYDVGITTGTLMLAEGWAVPVPSEDPALPVPIAGTAPVLDVPRTSEPPNLTREIYPPYFDHAPLAADSERASGPPRTNSKKHTP